MRPFSASGSKMVFLQVFLVLIPIGSLSIVSSIAISTNTSAEDIGAIILLRCTMRQYQLDGAAHTSSWAVVTYLYSEDNLI